MPILRMETELVRGAGHQLQQTSNTLQEQVQQLAHSVQALNTVWQGNSATVFAGEIQPLLLQLNQFAEIGTALNQRLQREVDEWERVSSIFGSGGSDLTVSEISKDINLFDTVQEKLAWLSNQSIWADIGRGLYGLSGLSFVLSSTYAGQVIVYGSRSSKELAGLSGHLTHLRGTNMPGHIFQQAGQVNKWDAASAFLQVAPQWMANYREYGEDPTKFAVANLVDTLAITGVGIGAVYLGGAGGAKIGGVIGFAVGGPVGAAVGATIGGVAGKISASYMADELITEPFSDSELRLDIIDQGSDVVKNTGSAIKSSFSEVVATVQEVQLPELKFSW